MKRVLFPKEERAIFFPSVPESINPLLLANSIAKELPKVVILIDASITQSEKLGEDACRFSNSFSRNKKLISCFLTKFQRVLIQRHLKDIVIE